MSAKSTTEAETGESVNGGQIRVVLADEHCLVRCALAQLVGTMPGIQVVATTGDDHELPDVASDTAADVALVDAAMLSLRGLNLAQQLRQSGGAVATVVMSTYASNAYIRRTLSEGASGFIHKDATVPELESVIRRAAAGERAICVAADDGVTSADVATTDPGTAQRPLTRRQRDVLRLVANGYRSRAIAEQLGVSVKTVETHRAEIMRRLGMHHIAGLVREAARLGLLSP